MAHLVASNKSGSIPAKNYQYQRNYECKSQELEYLLGGEIVSAFLNLFES